MPLMDLVPLQCVICLIFHLQRSLVYFGLTLLAAMERLCRHMTVVNVTDYQLFYPFFPQHRTAPAANVRQPPDSFYDRVGAIWQILEL